jgi:hypothetical protein
MTGGLGYMVFTKRLREGIRRGEITCSVRFWMGPRVRVGGRYPMEEGEIEVDSIEMIGFPDITPELARESGFLGVLDLLKVAKHGKGEKIYLVRFHYVKRRKLEKRKGKLGKAKGQGRRQKLESRKPGKAVALRLCSR